jgi:hypothetical protein
MTISIRRSWLLAASLGLLVGCGGMSKAPSPDEMAKDSAALQQVFPVLEELDVTGFRNQDWCRYLTYSRGKFVFTDSPDNADTCMFEGNGQPFDDAATRDFQAVSDALGKTDLTVQIADYIEFDAAGHVSTATFDLESAGFSGYWRYIYEPGAPLPEDMESELLSTRIDPDWYFQWEDWN